MRQFSIEQSNSQVIVILEGHSWPSKAFDKGREALSGKRRWRGEGPEGYGLYGACQDDEMSSIDAMVCIFEAEQEEAVRALCDRTYGRVESAIQELYELQRRLEALEEEIRNIR